MLVLYLTKQGDKVTHVIEFVDSTSSKNFFSRLLRHMKVNMA